MIPLNSEIVKTARAIQKANREVQQAKKKMEEENYLSLLITNVLNRNNK